MSWKFQMFPAQEMSWKNPVRKSFSKPTRLFCGWKVLTNSWKKKVEECLKIRQFVISNEWQNDLGWFMINAWNLPTTCDLETSIKSTILLRIKWKFYTDEKGKV